MAISLQQFMDSLVQSGLMSADEVSAFRERLGMPLSVSRQRTAWESL